MEIIQFCLKISDLLRHPHLWMGGSMAGARSSTKYRINLDLIERIQFCLTIYDGSMGRVMSNHKKIKKILVIKIIQLWTF